MRTGLLKLHIESVIDKTVIIARPVPEVYAFYRDFRNLPRFLGDVVKVEITGPTTSRWTMQAPFGIQIRWTTEVVEERPNEFIHYQTSNSPKWRTSWEIHFSSGSEEGQTEVRERMAIPLGKLGRAALGLLGKFPASEVSANLHRLKQVIESGTVTDTSYSVSGKFQ